MPTAIKPFDPEEEADLVALGNDTAVAWTVKLENRGIPVLVWAETRGKAAIVAQRLHGFNKKITAIYQNYQAQNMSPRPQNWREFAAAGGTDA